jgi:hypothetical protein
LISFKTCPNLSDEVLLTNSSSALNSYC